MFHNLGSLNGPGVFTVDSGFFRRMATMKEDASGRRQRAVMATDAEWERIGRAAAESVVKRGKLTPYRG